VTTSEDEQDVGKPLAWVGQTDLNVGGESYIFKSKLDPFFTAQLFLSQAFKRQSRKYLSGTKVKRISSSNLEKLVVCIPPLEIQRRIGETLKAMDALVNDISIGLPAEIEARRKQYEHYRNRLLSFKELDAA
jgi:type I restriction enzyme S subunit